jgi:hypothetical protein
MDESSLRLTIRLLNEQIGSLHTRNHIWTAVVILGCALEVMSVCREYLEDKGDWKKGRWRGLAPFPEKPSSSWLAFDILGVVLVVAGIAGELQTDMAAGTLETLLKSANENLVLLLEQRAGDAETSAKNAAAEATGAKGKADEVGKETDAAQLKIAGVQSRAEEIDQQLAWVKLTQSSRYVTDEDGLKNDLRKDFKGSHIAFRSYIGDPEAGLACDQLVQIALKAEVGPKDECGMEPLSRHPIIDLVIKGPDPDEVMRLTQTLKRSGRISGIQVNTGNAPSLTVFVAAKRSWFLGWPKKTPNTKASATKPAK